MLQWLGLGSRVRVGFRVRRVGFGVRVTDVNEQTHPHTNTQLVSQPSNHTRFTTLTMTKLTNTELGSQPSKIQC